LNPRDPLTFVGSAIVLTVAAGLAGFIPALRASSLEATTTLRHEWTGSRWGCAPPARPSQLAPWKPISPTSTALEVMSWKKRGSAWRSGLFSQCIA